MDLGLHGVHVIVTGASGGIGLATLQLFLEQGANVTAHYNTNSSTLEPFLTGPFASQIAIGQADLVVEEDVKRLFTTASNGSFGSVQVAIVNHGIWIADEVPLKDMSLERWNKTMDTNLTSSFLVAREYLKQLESASDDAKAKASMIFIGSCSGKHGEAFHADYAASKSAMMYGLTYTLKNEIVKIAPRGRVNSVAPGWVATPLAEESLKDPDVVYKSLSTYALKKFGLPFDVATQVVFLSSTKTSGHVSGQVVMVSGGMEGRLLNMPEDFN
ncbi:NAD(P)-binding protein [Mycena floridula]|nr:NAD(P)-binding protein [Mycena floridula]